MRLLLGMGFAVFGMMLLATPWLPIGVAMIVGGWWIYERSGLRGDDVLPSLIFLLGGGYATWLVLSAAAQWIRTLP